MWTRRQAKIFEAKLKIARLSPDAVPSVFPNCPAYLSAPATATSREAPDEKRMRLEAASLREAIAASVHSHEVEESRNKIDDFQALLERVSEIQFSSFWSVISRPTCVVFLSLDSVDTPRIGLSIAVSQDLTVKVHCRHVQLTTIDAAAVRICGPSLELEHVVGTAEFLEIITKWWSIVNVKTCKKGIGLRDELQSPITTVVSPQVQFLLTVVKWLDLGQSLKFDTGILTRETHSALRLTTDALVKVTKYCLEEMHFDYVLLGKFHTDCLEERFGKYRQLSGAQYHVSIRQVYESERKLRLQHILELPELETATAAVAVLDIFDIEVADDDYDKRAPNLHATTYVAGYCAHATFKKLACMACKANLMLDNNIEVEGFLGSIDATIE
ncbi:hypothetical protein MTO96_045749 [Rhipicephalus appendiculatus]